MLSLKFLCLAQRRNKNRFFFKCFKMQAWVCVGLWQTTSSTQNSRREGKNKKNIRHFLLCTFSYSERIFFSFFFLSSQKVHFWASAEAKRRSINSAILFPSSPSSFSFTRQSLLWFMMRVFHVPIIEWSERINCNLRLWLMQRRRLLTMPLISHDSLSFSFFLSFSSCYSSCCACFMCN